MASSAVPTSRLFKGAALLFLLLLGAFVFWFCATSNSNNPVHYSVQFAPPNEWRFGGSSAVHLMVAGGQTNEISRSERTHLGPLIFERRMERE